MNDSPSQLVAVSSVSIASASSLIKLLMRPRETSEEASFKACLGPVAGAFLIGRREVLAMGM
jgi:hypothetical protein